MVQPCRFELLLWQLFGLKLGSGGTAPTLSGDIEYLRVFGLPCRLRLSFVQDFGDTRVWESKRPAPEYMEGRSRPRGSSRKGASDAPLRVLPRYLLYEERSSKRT